MLKFVESDITFAEIPRELTLCINISNCPCHCPGCHSQHLWQDIGDELNLETLHKLIDPYKAGITCVCFMGGDSDPEEINFLALEIKNIFPGLKVAWYSGKTELSDKINIERFDYIKLGPYIEANGPLNNPDTNQRFYRVTNNALEDITYMFWKKYI